MDKKEIQRELRQSQDMAYLIRLLLFDVIGYGAVAGFMVLADDSASRREMVQMVLIIGALAVLPVLLFCLWRTVKIFRKPEGYIFRDVRLDRPKAGILRDTICFQVDVPLSNGKTIRVKTHSIFQTHGIGLLMEDYVNAVVKVAYNEQTKTLVVIG